MNKMPTAILRFSISVNASQLEVFNYLADWEKQSEWIMFTDVKKISPSQNTKGTELLATTKLGVVNLKDTMIVTEWSPPISITVEHTGRVILGKGIFTVQETSPGNCDFIWEEITPVPYGILGQIGFRVAKPFIKMMFNKSLRNLKKNMEFKS